MYFVSFISGDLLGPSAKGGDSQGDIPSGPAMIALDFLRCVREGKSTRKLRPSGAARSIRIPSGALSLQGL